MYANLVSITPSPRHICHSYSLLFRAVCRHLLCSLWCHSSNTAGVHNRKEGIAPAIYWRTHSARIRFWIFGPPEHIKEREREIIMLDYNVIAVGVKVSGGGTTSWDWWVRGHTLCISGELGMISGRRQGIKMAGSPPCLIRDMTSNFSRREINRSCSSRG